MRVFSRVYDVEIAVSSFPVDVDLVSGGVVSALVLAWLCSLVAMGIWCRQRTARHSSSKSDRLFQSMNQKRSSTQLVRGLLDVEDSSLFLLLLSVILQHSGVHPRIGAFHL